MRLFIAINFSEIIKDKLCRIEENLKQNSLQGNFTLRENLHLTLVFIGETAKAGEVKQAMDAVRENKFALGMSGFGRFRRHRGDICWVAVEKANELTSLYKQLADNLAQAGFKPEGRDYTPHLTLGREVVLKDGFQANEFAKSIPDMSMNVEKISLMKSERVNGKLTYTEIYSKELK
jgi:2'-5' RNA ligase